MSGIDKSIETESRSVVAYGAGGGKLQLTSPDPIAVTNGE